MIQASKPSWILITGNFNSELVCIQTGGHGTVKAIPLFKLDVNGLKSCILTASGLVLRMKMLSKFLYIYIVDSLFIKQNITHALCFVIIILNVPTYLLMNSPWSVDGSEGVKDKTTD